MISRSASLGRVAYHHRLRGLGQDPYQQWVQSLPAYCWQNNDPSSGVIIGTAGAACMTPASVLQATAALPEHQPSPENFVNPAVTATANNPTFVTNQVADAPLTANTANLEGHLAQAVTNAMANTATLAAVGDPTAYLNGFVSQYCASAGGLYTDSASNGCPQASALVAKYAAELQNAINAHAKAIGVSASSAAASSSGSPGPGYVWDGTCWRPAAGGSCWSGSGSNIPPSPGPGYVWDGTSWRPPSSTSTGSQSSSGPVVVNPSPASQSTTDGSSLTSGSSVTSVANGTSVQLIPGVPDTALFLGGGALALVLIVMMAGGK